MIHRRVHTVIAGSVIAIGATSIVLAQVRRERPAEVPLEVSLNVAGRQYSAKGLGSCTHAPKASIYDVIAGRAVPADTCGKEPGTLAMPGDSRCGRSVNLRFS